MYVIIVAHRVFMYTHAIHCTHVHVGVHEIATLNKVSMEDIFACMHARLPKSKSKFIVKAQCE